MKRVSIVSKPSRTPPRAASITARARLSEKRATVSGVVLEALKQAVSEANMRLPKHGPITFAWDTIRSFINIPTRWLQH